MDAFCHHHSMLYRTHHHPFLFQFPSFTSIPPLPSSSLQEMECVEAALKSSFRKEMGVKSSPQAFLEDVLVVNNGQNGVSCDDFSVDDLFDFTNEEDFLEQAPKEEEEGEEEEPVSSSCSNKRQRLSQEQHVSDETINFDYSSLSTDELAVPADDLASLEWLSHFVEDSFSEHSAAAYPAGTFPEKPKLNGSRFPEPETQATTYFKTPVPGKARSKRGRSGGRVWSLVASPRTETPSSSTSSSSSSLSASSPWFVYSSSVPGSAFEPSEFLPVEKKQKRPATVSNVVSTNQPTRRCGHCGVTKTPQWRAGPMGAKTLCNACGVRFKSGRLLPEYRPACSPTFSSELHSNHHRKVLEMRRKKECSGLTGPSLAPTSVPSFG